ncbi:MAG: hypothetical protein DRP64_11955 [Verrucomicrobia bacterium]|nr:MAG: hypothetical protein DRP64_11955 [Verrucomicrobiota bacterium]
MGKTRLGLLAIFMGSAIGARAQSIGVNHPATDDLGRKLPTYEAVGPVRADKVVGIFYLTWHSFFSVNLKAYDLSKIIAGHPEMVGDYDHPLWDPYADQTSFFWYEPIWGFTDGKDRWVARKQLEMLGDAGVDVLFFDATNGDWIWENGYDNLGVVMDEMRADGVANVPQFCFVLNLGANDFAARQLAKLYDDMYSVGKYKDSWFKWENKPCIMAYPESLDVASPHGTAFAATDVVSDDSAGMRFTAGSAFTGIEVQCPSMGNHIGNLTLSLYAWNADYATSVVQTSLASNTVVDFYDSSFIGLEFARQPAGNYVWELNDGSGGVGAWKFTDETPGIDSYYNGVLTSGDYHCRIKLAGGDFTALTSGSGKVPVDLKRRVSSATATTIKNFFTFRPCQPSYIVGPEHPKQWAWLENYPQHGFVEKSLGRFELMTVGTAQNHSELTHTIAPMNGTKIRGRSYTVANGFSQLTTNSYLQGYNFQEQWDRALQIDPDIVFVVSWNEWVMSRFEEVWGVENGFPDLFDLEYSRDIEPTKGGYGDNYYYQMISNIRKFKGMEPPQEPSGIKSIDLDGAFADWADVTPQFKDSKGNVKVRDGYGYIDPDSPTREHYHYTNNTARNDIIGAKVARDAANLYFYVKVAGSLTAHTDPDWMQLFIDTDRNKATGWEGYDLKIDRYGNDGKATLAKYSRGWNWLDAGQVDYRYAGAEMELGIDRSLLQLPTGQALDLEFKWLDSTGFSGDIMDVYSDGEAAPSGRFSYHYHSTTSPAPITGFNDFESGVAYGDWDITTTQAYSGTHSLECSANDNGGMVARNLPTTGKKGFRVSFQYMHQNLEADDHLPLYYHDGTEWVFIKELRTSENNVWMHYSDVRYNKGADAHFFNGPVAIKIQGASLSKADEFIWLDDLEMTIYSKPQAASGPDPSTGRPGVPQGQAKRESLE